MNEDNKQGIRIAIERLEEFYKECEDIEYKTIEETGKGDLVAFGRTHGVGLCIHTLNNMLEGQR